MEKLRNADNRRGAFADFYACSGLASSALGAAFSSLFASAAFRSASSSFAFSAARSSGCHIVHAAHDLLHGFRRLNICHSLLYLGSSVPFQLFIEDFSLLYSQSPFLTSSSTTSLDFSAVTAKAPTPARKIRVRPFPNSLIQDRSFLMWIGKLDACDSCSILSLKNSLVQEQLGNFVRNPTILIFLYEIRTFLWKCQYRYTTKAVILRGTTGEPPKKTEPSDSLIRRFQKTQ